MMVGVPGMIYFNVSTNGATGGTFRVVYARVWEYDGNWSTYDTTNKWSYSIEVVNPTQVISTPILTVIAPQDITTPILNVIVPQDITPHIDTIIVPRIHVDPFP